MMGVPYDYEAVDVWAVRLEVRLVSFEQWVFLATLCTRHLIEASSNSMEASKRYQEFADEATDITCNRDSVETADYKHPHLHPVSWILQMQIDSRHVASGQCQHQRN